MTTLSCLSGAVPNANPATAAAPAPTDTKRIVTWSNGRSTPATAPAVMRLFLTSGLVLAVAGCSTLPKFETLVGPSQSAPTVNDVITHIQCEIRDSLRDVPRFSERGYVVYASLTLDVTDNQGLTPSLSFIHPYSLSGTGRTDLISPQISGQQHRQISQTFTLDLDPDHKESSQTLDAEKECHGERAFGLRGDLGIEEIIKTGFAHSRDQDFIFPIPAPGSKAAGYLSNSPDFAPVFGSQIDFTIAYGLGGGPNWTITHFSGPNGSSGLVNLSRTDKDTLTLSFAPAKPLRDQSGKEPAVRASTTGLAPTEQAARAAQDNLTRMFLQQVLSQH